jgi:hypothetical protein
MQLTHSGNCGSSGGSLMLCDPKVGWHSDYGDKLIDIDFEEISGILGQAAKNNSRNAFGMEGGTVKCQQMLFAHVAFNASDDAIRLYLRHLLGDPAHCPRSPKCTADAVNCSPSSFSKISIDPSGVT